MTPKESGINQGSLTARLILVSLNPPGTLWIIGRTKEENLGNCGAQSFDSWAPLRQIGIDRTHSTSLVFQSRKDQQDFQDILRNDESPYSLLLLKRYTRRR